MSKIIFVATVAETHLAFLRGQASALQKIGYKILLVSSPSKRLEKLCQVENFEYKPINIGRRINPLRDIFATIRLFFLFLWQKPDLVHLSTPKAAFIGSIAAFFSRVPNRFFLIRGSVTGADRGWSSTLNRWCEWLTVRLSNEVLVVSPSLLDFLRNQRVLKKYEGRVISNGMSNGIDSQRFKPAYSVSHEFRCSDSIIGFVGRLNKEKGIEELAQAWTNLREKFPETRLLLVGPWDTEAEINEDLRKQLESDPRVEITGRVDDVRPFYERMRVLCFPSHREGFPNVVMEAAAMGVPVVGAKAIGTIDAIVDGQTGTLVRIGNVSELTAALEQYMNDAELARQHGENGRQRVTADFSQASIWDGLQKCYEDNIRQSKNKTGLYRSVCKPIGDRVLSLVALVVLSPLLFCVSLLVRFRLGKPIFFSQVRPGYKGRPFRLWKFRTMLDSCDAAGNVLPDAQRMTPFGKFLRSTSLDELPELWNILCGHMSFVGPRPLLMEYLSRYSKSQRQRHDVLPGLTGLAQVKGRNQLSWKNKFRYDLFYVRKYNVAIDLFVLLKTVEKVFARDGITDGKSVSNSKFSQEKAVAIIGAGGHARVVISTLRSCGINVLEIYDDNREIIGTNVDGVPVVARIDALSNKPCQNVNAIIAIGSNERRHQIVKSFEGTKINWKTVIHKNAIVDPTVLIGKGTFVAAGVVIQANTKIGSHVIVNTRASVDHDCVIADFSHIGPGSIFTGGVVTEEESFVGAGCKVLPGLRIGKQAIAGAGSVITKNINDSTTVIGCPARTVSKVNLITNRNSKSPKWPIFDEEQISVVEKVLRSGKVNYWTGEEGKYFEKEFADYVGVTHGIAVANGTVALELALEALRIGAGDEVIVPSRTFIASASAVVMRGAVPKIADIDPVSQNISVDSIRDQISSRTKAIIVVHLGGWPCDMDEILAFSKNHNLFVIEDCAQAHGARYKGKHVGSFGDIAAFSFCQDKIMTTAGEGGMVVTNDSALWKRAWSFKDHGKDWDLVNRPSDGTYRFLHTSFGTNWRMTEVQAAIGRVQLRKLDHWHAERSANAAFLSERLKNCPGMEISLPPHYSKHAFYRLYASIHLKDLQYGWTRDEIIKQLRLKNVEVGCGSCAEIYREKAFEEISEVRSLPNAIHAQQASLAFFVHPGITRAMLSNVAEAVYQIMSQATKYPLHKQNFAA